MNLPPRAAQSPRPDSQVGRSVGSGLRWKSATQLIGQASRLPVAILVARELTPRELGLAAMALVFVGIAALTAGFGTDTAFVQEEEANEDDLSTIFWSTIAVGAALSIAAAAIAPAAASWFHSPHEAPLFAAAAAAFFLSSLGTTHRAVLTRELRFRELETGTIAAGLAGSAVLVGTALAGLGAWALVLQQLASIAVVASVAWLQCPWRPGARFSLSRLRVLAPVSLDVLLTRLSLGTARLVDNVIIGRFLGAAALGTYSLAYNVMLLPSSRLTAPLQDVLYPVFARIRDDRAQLAAIWTRSTRGLVLLVVPYALVALVASTWLVKLLFGTRWESAAPLVRILVAAGVLQAVSSGNIRLLVAFGRSRSVSRFAVAWLVTVVAAVAIAVHWGILWVCVAYSCATAVFAPVLFLLIGRALGLGARELSAPFRAAVVPGAAMAATMLAVAGLSRRAGAPGEVAAGLVAYAAVCAWRIRRDSRSWRLLLRVGGRP